MRGALTSCSEALVTSALQSNHEVSGWYAENKGLPVADQSRLTLTYPFGAPPTRCSQGLVVCVMHAPQLRLFIKYEFRGICLCLCCKQSMDARPGAEPEPLVAIPQADPEVFNVLTAVEQRCAPFLLACNRSFVPAHDSTCSVSCCVAFAGLSKCSSRQRRRRSNLPALCKP